MDQIENQNAEQVKANQAWAALHPSRTRCGVIGHVDHWADECPDAAS